MALREIVLSLAIPAYSMAGQEALVEEMMRPIPIEAAIEQDERFEAEEQGMKPLKIEEERERSYDQTLPKIISHQQDPKHKYQVEIRFSNSYKGSFTLTEWPKQISKRLGLKDEQARDYLFKPIFLRYLPIMTDYDFEEALDNAQEIRILELVQEHSDFPAVIAAMAALESKLRPDYGETNGYHGLLQINEGVLMRAQSFYKENDEEFSDLWRDVRDIKPGDILDPVNQIKIVNADIYRTIHLLKKACPKIKDRDLLILAAVGHNGGPNGMVRYVEAAYEEGKNVSWVNIAFDYCSVGTVRANIPQIESLEDQIRKKWIMLRYGFEFEILRERFEEFYQLKIVSGGKDEDKG